MSQTLQDWSCGSECSPPRDCRLRTCSNAAFPYTFSGSGKVGVMFSSLGSLFLSRDRFPYLASHEVLASD